MIILFKKVERHSRYCYVHYKLGQKHLAHFQKKSCNGLLSLNWITSVCNIVYKETLYLVRTQDTKFWIQILQISHTFPRYAGCNFHKKIARCNFFKKNRDPPTTIWFCYSSKNLHNCRKIYGIKPERKSCRDLVPKLIWALSQTLFEVNVSYIQKLIQTSFLHLRCTL